MSAKNYNTHSKSNKTLPLQGTIELQGVIPWNRNSCWLDAILTLLVVRPVISTTILKIAPYKKDLSALLTALQTNLVQSDDRTTESILSCKRELIQNYQTMFEIRSDGSGKLSDACLLLSGRDVDSATHLVFLFVVLVRDSKQRQFLLKHENVQSVTTNQHHRQQFLTSPFPRNVILL